MATPQAVITDFLAPPTQFSSLQSSILEWIVNAHTQAESIQRGNWSLNEKEAFAQELRERLWHVGCKPNIIEQRGHVISDFLHCNWPEMQVYRLDCHPQGINAQSRQALHQEIVDNFFEYLYRDEVSSPTGMVHVSCTGYASPSGAQKTISRKHWEGKSTVTHVYHMGCYGALPAIRIGNAFAQAPGSRIDIVHTELCCLHMNSLNHSSSQLVSQTLFADGCIKYSIVSEKKVEKCRKPFLRIIGHHEHIIPDSTEYMEWVIGDAGFHFVLAKEIPVLVSRFLQEYLIILCQKAGIKNCDEFVKQAIFAVHPGGPKILDYVQKGFALKNDQLQSSRNILRKYGNMSSATLPYIWQEILNNPNIKSGSKILSMAFGPGLTIAGIVLEKIG